MKSILFQILFLLSPFCFFGQQKVCLYNNFETLDGDTINQIENNQKIGKWINYEKSGESISCFTSEPCYHQTTIAWISSHGNYHDNKKIGEWIYYEIDGTIRCKKNYSSKNNGATISIEYSSHYKKSRGEIIIANGVRNSVLVLWDSGLKKYEAIYNGDVITEFCIYHENGSKKINGFKVKGWEIGSVDCFDSSGNSTPCRYTSFGLLMLYEGLEDFL